MIEDIDKTAVCCAGCHYEPFAKCIHTWIRQQCFGSVDETESASESSELVARLLLHEVKAHGDEGQATDEVQTADDVLLRSERVERRARHIVAEPDRRQSDEAEIGGDERLPSFPQMEQERTQQDVAGHQ